MPATRISGPGLSKGGPEGRRGLKGDKPAHELDGLRIRWERPDGSPGEWIDLNDVVGLRFQGDWDAATAYENNDLVRYGNATYVARRQSTGAIPGEETDDWRLFVPGGTVGDGAITRATISPTAFATQAEAEIQREDQASALPLINPLRMLQGVRASLKENGTITPYMTGARGDGSADDRAAFQAAIDEAENTPYSRLFGRVVFIPAGVFRLGESTRGANTACLHAKGAASLAGVGRLSRVGPNPAAVASTSSFLAVKPDDTEMASGWRCENWFMGDSSNGRRHGLHGIYLDSRQAGAHFPAIKIRNMYIVQSTSGTDINRGRAVFHDNNEDLNQNGGMYLSVIEGCRLGGGVSLFKSGDSNKIVSSSISGFNNVAQLGYRCVGVDAELCVTGGGAGFLVLEDLNISTEAGAYRITQGKDIHISRVYGEHLSADAGIPFTRTDGSTGRALAVIESTGNTMLGGSITGGRLSASTGVSTLIDAALYLQNVTRYAVGGGLSIYPGKPSGGRGIELGSNAFDNVIRSDEIYYSPAIADADRVVDAGQRNRWSGRREIVPDASFGAFGSGTATPVASRLLDRRVALEGFLSADAPAGKRICTLPVGYRPPSTVFTQIYADAAGVPVAGAIEINSGGEVIFRGASTATRLSLNCQFALA